MYFPHAAVDNFKRLEKEGALGRFGFYEALAHRIIAGADLLLVPSRFEPCGLTQMYAQRYGTVPLVRRTGGLADTIRDADDDPDTGNGFAFAAADTAAFVDAARRAISAYGDPARWAEIQRRGMLMDSSWAGPAARRFL